MQKQANHLEIGNFHILPTVKFLLMSSFRCCFFEVCYS